MHDQSSSVQQDAGLSSRPCVSLQVTALKNLNLNIRKAALVSPGKASTFFITDADTSEKVLKSARLEEIRMTIINNMLYYHPVSKSCLSIMLL